MNFRLTTGVKFFGVGFPEDMKHGRKELVLTVFDRNAYILALGHYHHNKFLYTHNLKTKIQNMTVFFLYLLDTSKNEDHVSIVLLTRTSPRGGGRLGNFHSPRAYIEEESSKFL